MNKVKKIRKIGSGRTKGSYSFCCLTLEDLNRMFADKKTEIPVGRLWAETLKIKNKKVVTSVEVMKSTREQEPFEVCINKVEMD